MNGLFLIRCMKWTTLFFLFVLFCLILKEMDNKWIGISNFIFKGLLFICSTNIRVKTKDLKIGQTRAYSVEKNVQAGQTTFFDVLDEICC